MNIKEQLQEAIANPEKLYKHKYANSSDGKGLHIWMIDAKTAADACEAILDDVAIKFGEYINKECLVQTSDDKWMWLPENFTVDTAPTIKAQNTKELFTYYKENVYGKD